MYLCAGPEGGHSDAFTNVSHPQGAWECRYGHHGHTHLLLTGVLGVTFATPIGGVGSHGETTRGVLTPFGDVFQPHSLGRSRHLVQKGRRLFWLLNLEVLEIFHFPLISSTSKWRNTIYDL